jgi:baculoviral IAP repeat-containing protein 6
MWQPNKSTVLAVLISIQAMILGAPVPWVNEPGFATHENTPQAKDHKLLIQTKTVKYAMIGWLENKFNVLWSKEYIWRDISKTYWKHNGKAALDTVKTWANDNPDLVHFGARAPAPKRRKGKSKEVQPEATPTSGGQDLVEKLAQCLGLPGDNSSPHKRKASSSGTSNDSKKQKSETSEDESIEMRWYYKGAKTQKDVRAACKEFGIGAAPTIDACIGKLEKHVNTKGKASEELVEKWGEMREVVVRLVDGL